MKENLPKPLRDALDRRIEFFMGEEGEWKLEIEDSAKFIEERVEVPVCVFANNGFGDYLFLKKGGDGNGFSETVFEYLHEGPEIVPVQDELSTLLGLVERPPSTDGYPKAVYRNGELVEPGDRVQVKVWAEFWKGWQDGEVRYVPGVSKKKTRYEYNGLKWVAIRFRNGEICPLVDPKTGKLGNVKFVGRGNLKGARRSENRRKT